MKYFAVILLFLAGTSIFVIFSENEDNSSPVVKRLNDLQQPVSKGLNKKALPEILDSQKEKSEIHTQTQQALSKTPDLDELLLQYKELQNLFNQSPACNRYPKEKIACLHSVYENLKAIFENENSELSRSGELGLSALNEVQVELCTNGPTSISQICHDLVLDLKDSSLQKSKSILKSSCKTNARGCSALASIMKKDGKSSDQELGLLYQKGCFSGEFFSCHDGALVYKQLGDFSNSYALFKKSCFLGNSIGCLEALSFEEEMDKTTKTFALKNIEKHCKDQKHVHSCRRLSKVFLKEKSFEDYYRVLKYQCEFGDSDACVSYLNFLIDDNPEKVLSFKKKICTWYRNFENNIDEKTTSSLNNFTCSQAQRCIANDDLSEFPDICYGENG